MKRNKKKTLIISFALTGALLLSGVGVALGKSYTYSNKLADAKVEMNQHQDALSALSEELNKVMNKDGFIVETVDLESIESQLKAIPDAESAFDIKAGDLTKEIELIRTSKDSVEKLMQEIKDKMKTEKNVNALFVEKVISGVDVKEVAVNKEIKETEVVTLLDTIESQNEWGKAIRDLLENAIDQVKHNESTANKIDKLAEEKAPTRKSYDEVNKLAEMVKNEEVKKDFETKLADVLVQVEQEENRVADAKAQQEKEAEAQRQAQQQTQSNNTSTNGVVNNGSTSNQTSTSAPKSQNAQTKPSTNNQTTAPKNNTQTTAPKKNTQTSTSKPSTQPSKPSTSSKPSNGGGHLGSVEINGSGNTMDSWEVSDSELNDLFGN